ncbi:carbon-nitrogen hydrolase family protein [Spirosoma sp.]|uniref:carbon-nitrogen hydrolase family protein n=1 Tax=Spirosoma sp. TaxID=1899569 RepID=UPI003B3B791B
MKIAVAQTRPIRGDIRRNIEKHTALIDLAASAGASMVIFSELSLTGYEPELAGKLATYQDDSRFEDIQKISDAKTITIGAGMPTVSESGIRISMLIFQPNSPRQVYSKQHLHADEFPYFVAGDQPVFLTKGKQKVALAICYELSIPGHSAYAVQQGATVYVASVAKTLTGVENAGQTLSNIANTCSIPVLMANCIGYCDTFESAGNSAIWNSNGVLIGQLKSTDEGILMIDTETQDLVEKLL